MSIVDSVRVPAARRSQILAYLAEKGSASIGQLAAALNVSVATVHRDLRALESEELLRRVQGGATSLGPGRPIQLDAVDPSWSHRLEHQANAKFVIAFAAIDLIERGDTIFLDGSTTSLALAAAIESTGLSITIVTTSPAIAQTFTSPAARVVLVPGEVDQQLRIITGSWANDFLDHFNFTSAFVSCAGMGADGSMFTDSREIQVTLQRALSRAQRKVCILDTSKVGRFATLTLCTAADLDIIVVDSALPRPVQAVIEGLGTKIINSEATIPESLTKSAIFRQDFSFVAL